MGGRRARGHRRRRLRAPALTALAAVVVTVAVVAIGMNDSPTPHVRPPAASPSRTTYPSPPAASVDLSGLPIARRPFCDRIDDEAVTTALDGPVTLRNRYGSGDRAELAPGVRDIAHEYSCSFTTNSGAQARAWVFAEPVGSAEASRLVRGARGRSGCTYPESAPGYGDPTLTSRCEQRHPDIEVVTLRGLFGDAWLSCQLTVPGHRHPKNAVARAQQWCVHVAVTLGARP
ncbi:MAG TPA: hypothetical protein VFJ19_01020 [Nocardioidaceae bacterium]|nr:hypothetical protein [Nocardioidaceae bacterium]